MGWDESTEGSGHKGMKEDLFHDTVGRWHCSRWRCAPWASMLRQGTKSSLRQAYRERGLSLRNKNKTTKQKQTLCQEWRLTPVIPAFDRQRQEDGGQRSSCYVMTPRLGCLRAYLKHVQNKTKSNPSILEVETGALSSRPTRTIVRLCLQKQTEKKNLC